MNKKGFALTFIGVLFMSFETLIIKKSPLNAYNFVFFFNIFLCLSVFLHELIKNKNLNFLIPKDKKMLIAGLLGASSNFGFIIAVKYLSVGSVIFIMSSSPLICALFSLIFFKVKTPKVIFLCAFITLFGIFMVVSDVSFDNFTGLIFTFISLFSFSSYFVLLCAMDSSINKNTCIIYSSFLSVVISFGFVSLEHIQSIDYIFYAFLMGAFVTPISRIFIAKGSNYLLAAEIGLLLVLESIIAPIFAFLFLKERLSVETIFGGICVICSVIIYILVNAKGEKNER